MIEFNYENDFQLQNVEGHRDWLMAAIDSEQKQCGDISFIFCDDEYLHRLNLDFLNHDTLTDIISFDYSVGDLLQGDIFISTERVTENALDFNVSFDDELRRVLVHGVLHFCGYKDKTEEEATQMRLKEEEKMSLFHVERSSDK